MEFTKDEINEFVTDCSEMIETAELEFLNLQDQLSENAYNSIFRAFHSIKGGAGMFGFNNLQKHLHTLESEFIQFKETKKIVDTELTYFLEGIDTGRKLLEYVSVNDNDLLPGYQELSSLAVFKNNNASVSNQNPITKKASEKAQSSDSVPTSTNASTSSVTNSKPIGIVYCVDDEQDILDILKDILESSHFQCEVFLKPSELYKKVRSNPPDVIITDFRMPEESGLKVLETVKKIDPEIQVVLLSGFLEKNVLIDSLKLGLFSALEKPFTDNHVITNVVQANNYRRLIKSFSRSINLMLYQFSELDEYLKNNNKEDVRKIIREELSNLLAMRKELRKMA